MRALGRIKGTGVSNSDSKTSDGFPTVSGTSEIPSDNTDSVFRHLTDGINSCGIRIRRGRQVCHRAGHRLQGQQIFHWKMCLVDVAQQSLPETGLESWTMKNPFESGSVSALDELTRLRRCAHPGPGFDAFPTRTPRSPCIEILFLTTHSWRLWKARSTHLRFASASSMRAI